MKVRYNPFVGVVLVVLGGACEFLGLWLLLLGEFSPAVIAGVVPLLFGVLHLARPYFFVHQGLVTVKAVIGPVERKFPFQTLELDGKRVFAVAADGTRKRVPVSRAFSQPADWEAAIAHATVRQG
jgi:hypothetical protein